MTKTFNCRSLLLRGGGGGGGWERQISDGLSDHVWLFLGFGIPRSSHYP